MQDELNEIVTTWNSHRIIAKAGHGVIGGRPILMYTLPEMYRTKDNLKAVDMDEFVRRSAPPKASTHVMTLYFISAVF